MIMDTDISHTSKRSRGSICNINSFIYISNSLAPAERAAPAPEQLQHQTDRTCTAAGGRGRQTEWSRICMI